MALIAGGVFGYLVLLVLHLAGKGALVGATVLNMAVLGAVIAYAMQMLSFILLAEQAARYGAALRQHARVCPAPGSRLASRS